MKLPNESQLSLEQKEVCFAPPDENILVVGPPGSGKTVVAVFRKTSMQKQNSQVQTLVHNHVLSRYTDVETTFLAWLSQWWRRATGSAAPKDRSTQQFALDYDSMLSSARSEYRKAIARKGNWGHLIIDEAQDLDQRAHKLLAGVQEKCFPSDEMPALSILADENQRLTASNSTIDEITDCYLIAKSEVYQLTQNYRNTREIADLASEFYVGLSSGIPSLPDRRGDLPQCYETSQLNDAITKIANFVTLNPTQDVGVLVLYKGTRKKLYNRLKHRLPDSDVIVQEYESSGQAKENARALQFDKGGSVTVLCYASAKGLEFDTVFLPELQHLDPSRIGQVETRMTLYVMLSRARDGLFLMLTDPERKSHARQLLKPAIDQGKLLVR